jgi:hypothetical protein
VRRNMPNLQHDYVNVRKESDEAAVRMVFVAYRY